MVQLTTRERVDAFWATTLNVEVADLHTPGVHVRSNPPERADWRGIYVLTFDKAACVFAPVDLLDLVTPAVADLDAEAATDPATWHALLGEAVGLAFGPVVHHYLDDDAGLADIAAGRRINPDDAAALAALRGAVPPDEWVSAGFAAPAAMLFGIFRDLGSGSGQQLRDLGSGGGQRRMVAAANLTTGPDAATDVGIVVHPDERGQGYAIQIAATATRQALQMHGIARFRVLATSTSTLAIAARLGFEIGRAHV